MSANKLFHWTHDHPIQLEGEGNISTNNFRVGMQVGQGIVTDIIEENGGITIKRRSASGYPVRNIRLRGTGTGMFFTEKELETQNTINPGPKK
jgi:hypothetical protein